MEFLWNLFLLPSHTPNVALLLFSVILERVALKASAGHPNLRLLALITICLQVAVTTVRAAGATVGRGYYLLRSQPLLLDPRWECVLVAAAVTAPAVWLFKSRKETLHRRGPVLQLFLSLFLVANWFFMGTDPFFIPSPAYSPDGKWQVWVVPVDEIKGVAGPILIRQTGGGPWWTPLTQGHRILSNAKDWHWVQVGQSLRLVVKASWGDIDGGTVDFGPGGPALR